MDKYLESLSTFLEDSPNDKGEAKLKIIQEVTENFETIVASPLYPQFLEAAVPIFLKFFEDGEAHFVGDYPLQQARKAVLETLHRLPCNEILRPFVRPILTAVFRLLGIDNEENVLICLRIIIELHKQFRPQFSSEVQNFLVFVRSVYKDLPKHMEKIFEPKLQVRVKDLSEINFSNSPALDEIYSVTTFQSDKKNAEGGNVTYTVLPKARNSLKVLQELPIIVVLMYQIYKTSVQQEVADFIPIVMSTITLQPNENHRTSSGFNKEVLVEFMGAQVKTLSFLAYIIKLYQDLVTQHSDLLVNGLINLLSLCPMEVAQLRRELFIAARHIMATELRYKFVPHMDKLFDEDVLLGKGWTVNETMRPLAYSTLADLVHHVRQHLSLADLSKAVTFFSYHVHDETLPLSIQTMSCKLLFNLVESIRLKSESDNGNGREILMKMLDVLVYKFKIVAQVHIPFFTSKFNALAAAQADKKPEAEQSLEDILNRGFSSNDSSAKEEPRRYGFPQAPMQNYLFHECRTLVKTVVCAVKTISWGIASCRVRGTGNEATPTTGCKQFTAKETDVYLRLMKWGLKAVDIYAINGPVTNFSGQTIFMPQRTINTQGVRSKEEKEVLEHFAGAFTLLNTYTFRELFSVRIKLLVERIYENNALQVVANNLLANPTTSAIFATILVEFLLEKLPDMGEDAEKSGLYLRLFKLVFGSVSLFPSENEQMLKPHLREIVNRSMELALNAKDPYNYFLLLRALFRSIGGGSHDLLYQEFLPLLPSLLQGLNSLQSGLHKQHMKDLFVELCLTVPVRLSSLLPYLPMLMDPLVSALNGSPTLVSQGLRTLELCVDNLQPEFLYEHIQPVRADLMQALWRTLRNPTDSTATVAYRILGKFGGSNRKMLVEPQKLEFGDKTNQGPQVQLYFQDHKASVSLPVEKPIETAYSLLKSSTAELHYKKHAWELLKSYLIASMVTDEDRYIVNKGVLHSSLHNQEITSVPVYKYSDEKSRQVHATALSGVFVASATKELKQEVYNFLVPLMRHYGMIAVAQQIGPFLASKYHGMDPYVIFDAASMVLAGEEKEFEHSVFFALSVLMNLLINMVGTKERACSLQMMEYLTDKITTLCYERAWYTKMGGCNAIDFLLDHMSSKWILSHHINILKGMVFVLTDLSGEVSSGAVEAAKNNLEKSLRICVAVQDPHLLTLKDSSMAAVTIELVRHVTSSVTNVREESMKNLKRLAELQQKSLSEIIQPHMAIIADMVPPKKHSIRHQSLQSQLGILDGNSFCLSITPKLFTIDFSLSEHRTFITEVTGLCETDDAGLIKLPCYKGVLNLISVRIAILKVLSCVIVTSPVKEKIVSLFLKSLANSNSELQLAAFDCMKKFIVENPIDVEIINQAIRPVLASLTNIKSVTMEVLRQAAFLYQLAPESNTKMWETLLQILRRFLECALVNHTKSPSRSGSHEFKIAISIVDHFELLTQSSQGVRFLEPFCKLCLQAEKALLLGKGCPIRPNLMKYLLKLPQEYINHVFTTYLALPEWNRFFLYFLKQTNAGILRETLLLNSSRIVHSLSIRQNPLNLSTSLDYTEVELADIQYLGVKSVYILSRFEEELLLCDEDIFKALKTLWETPDYQQGLQLNNRKLDVQSWKEPLYVAKLLLMYHKKNPDDIDLLFSLLLAFCGKPVSQYQFLKEFLETTVTITYSLAWKRQAFLRFVDIFGNETYPSELKAKIIQYILIPCMTYCFEQGLGDEFVGSSPMPDVDSSDNIVSVLLSKVIDAENPNAQGDNVRIVLCQLSCLLVEVAAAHIHDASNKKQGNKLRRLMTFAWPCLLSKTCVDSSTKYYGHLLLSHIIAKFAIHKRIVLQVFHSLLKASVMEAKSVIKQALEIITPALPLRMEDGNTMLIHWTKKILVEEGHSLAQLTHILQLIVRHWKVYFPVRLLLINHMISAIQRLGFTQASTFEHRRLAVELSEVIIKWELERIKTEGDEVVDKKPLLLPTGKVDAGKNLERSHTDAVVNFLLRMACQVNDTTPTPGTPGEILSRRCVTLLKTVLKPNIWPNCDLKLAWFDKLLLTLETPQPNYLNICTALDLLAFITGILTKEQVLEQFKGLQKGIAACMVSQNNKVIRTVHNLMTKLMGVYPTDFPGGSSTMQKCEELDHLYGNVSKLVFDALVNYEKLTTSSPSTLLGPLMMLKSACTANPCYIDRIITAFMKVLQRLSKDHLSPGSPDSQVGTDLLVLSMDLVKNRVGVMGVEMRKAFIGTVLVSLIEKTTDSKVMQGIVKMLEEWVKNKSPIVVNQGPSSREKSILLVKMMQNAEKRFPNDQELVGQFLELVNFIYRDDHLKGTELNSKLEPAFLSGLRCTQSSIRRKFFEVFDSSIRKRLHDRLMYIMCSQNWEAMGPHYWIKQCIELLFGTVADVDIQVIPPDMILPGIAHGFHFLDAASKEVFLNTPDIKEEPMDTEMPLMQFIENNLETLENLPETEVQSISEVVANIENMFMNSWDDPSAPLVNVKTFLIKERHFKNSLKQVKLANFVTSLIQICHYDTNLAEKVWITFFPRAWKIFSEKHQMALANEMVPFLCSGVHVIQKDCNPSALNTFAEAICQCVPSVSMKPIVLFYLAKNHNLWHRMSLLLEQYVLDTGNTQQLKAKKDQTDCYEFEPSTSSHTSPGQHLEVMDTLSDLYSSLKEEDLWAGLWQRRAKYTDTNIGIAFANQGFYEKAQGAFELAMGKSNDDYAEETCPSSIFPEFKLWEEHWLKCTKELNQWDIAQDYGSANEGKNPILVLDSVWRQGSWSVVKDMLSQVETACPKEFAWKVHLYRGYLAICSTDDQNLTMVDRYVEGANQVCIKDWRRLPHLVSNVHIPILQAAQQIVELHEATQIHQGFIQGRPNTLHDMKAVVKTWRNRLPCISDDLSHWGDIFTWRQQHYQFISTQFDAAPVEAGAGGGSQGMLGVHASAQAICHFGKIARKQNLTAVCLDSLSKIYAIPSVPIVDCFQKIKQQVKCYIQQAQILGRNELQEALEIVESTNLKYFSKEMTAEFFTLKASLLSQIGRSDEANKAFSASCQLNDNLSKAWGFWGDYLEGQYSRDPSRNMSIGISAVTAFMQACRHQNEAKARKYIAKILWLLTYDDEKGTLADVVDKYSTYVPPIQWLPWVPQLLTLLVRHDGKMVINLLNAVGRMYPQAVYFPIRTLYLTLKIEQRERLRNAEFVAAQSSSNSSAPSGESAEQEGSGVNVGSGTGTAGSTQPGEAQAMKATPSMWRCSRIMHMQRDLHPTVLASLEGIVDQIVWFRENWYEEVLRQLKIGLAKCYAIAFDNRANVLDAQITPQLANYVRKLASTFGHAGIGTTSGSGSTTIEALLRRSTVQDPAFQQMKLKFTVDFDTSVPGAQKLHNLIISLRKWIKILEVKTKLYSKSFLMEDRFRFLQNFSTQMAEIELPGEFLIPKHSHYYVKIARFQPRVEVVHKHNTSARRIFIRGHNGKIYPYLIVNDSGLTDARREERVMQMMRMMNHYLGRQKVTAKRNLKFTVPKVVAVSPQMRLVEDNPSSLSLLDVFKHSCSKRGVEYDTAITRYYEKIAAVQTRGAPVSHQVLREILRDIQANIVPRTMMKEWALNTFATPSDYWMFRKTFTLQLALADFAEYSFHLTRLNPEMMYLHQDSGMVNISYFKFELDDGSGELESNRPVPFRLTPNISEFITPFGVSGPIVSSMISLARCLVYPNYKLQAILRAILRDEMIAWLQKKQNDREIINVNSGSRESLSSETDAEAVINMVTKSVTAIMNRLQLLSSFDGVESKVSTLVAAANSHDNLCRMDPAWHPWL